MMVCAVVLDVHIIMVVIRCAVVVVSPSVCIADAMAMELCLLMSIVYLLCNW